MLSYIVLCLELQKKLIPNWIGYTGIPRLNMVFLWHSAIYLTILTSMILFTKNVWTSWHAVTNQKRFLFIFRHSNLTLLTIIWYLFVIVEYWHNSNMFHTHLFSLFETFNTFITHQFTFLPCAVICNTAKNMGWNFSLWTFCKFSFTFLVVLLPVPDVSSFLDWIGWKGGEWSEC